MMKNVIKCLLLTIAILFISSCTSNNAFKQELKLLRNSYDNIDTNKYRWQDPNYQDEFTSHLDNIETMLIDNPAYISIITKNIFKAADISNYIIISDPSIPDSEKDIDSYVKDLVYAKRLMDLVFYNYEDKYLELVKKIVLSEDIAIQFREEIFNDAFSDKRNLYQLYSKSTNYNNIKSKKINSKTANLYDQKLTKLGKQLIHKGSYFDPELFTAKYWSTTPGFRIGIPSMTYCFQQRSFTTFINTMMGKDCEHLDIEFKPINQQLAIDLLQVVYKHQEKDFFYFRWLWDLAVKYDEKIKEKYIELLKAKFYDNDTHTLDKLDYGKKLLDFGIITQDEFDLTVYGYIIKNKSRSATIINDMLRQFSPRKFR